MLTIGIRNWSLRIAEIATASDQIHQVMEFMSA
jgi:hypothetical protein